MEAAHLLEMGFPATRADEAVQRCSSIEACVEYLVAAAASPPAAPVPNASAPNIAGVPVAPGEARMFGGKIMQFEELRAHLGPSVAMEATQVIWQGLPLPDSDEAREEQRFLRPSGQPVTFAAMCRHHSLDPKIERDLHNAWQIWENMEICCLFDEESDSDSSASDSESEDSEDSDLETQNWKRRRGSTDDGWRKYSGVNCYPKHTSTAVWFDGSKEESKARGRRGSMSVEAAKRLCVEEGAKAFTISNEGLVWLLLEVDPSQGKTGTEYDLYVAPAAPRGSTGAASWLSGAASIRQRTGGDVEIVHISDTHCLLGEKQCDALPEADILAVTGDFTDKEKPMGPGEWAFFNKMLSLLQPKYALIVVICGNHDIKGLRTYKDLEQRFKERITTPSKPGHQIVCLANEMIKFRGLKIHGVSWFPCRASNGRKWRKKPPSGSKLEDYGSIKSDVDVLLTHGPPRHHGEKKTCTPGLKEAIKRVKPKLHLYGHVHGDNNEGKAKTEGNTLTVNSAMCKGHGVIRRSAHVIRGRKGGEFKIVCAVKVPKTNVKRRA